MWDILSRVVRIEKQVGVKRLMNIYDQLRSLQVINNAYSEWEHYRYELTEIIIKYAQGSESIALFGAGRCNDIDLKRLAVCFNEVILFDKDQEAMKEALYQQKVERMPNIKMKVTDFVGIHDSDYRVYADTLISEIRKKGMGTSCHALAEVALEQLEMLYTKAMDSPICFGTGAYDCAVVVGVHSQLISMLEWIWSIMLQTIKQDETSVRNKIIEMNEAFVARFNNAVIEGTRNKIIMGCEKARVGKEGTVQGAVQALYDLKRRHAKGEINICEAMDIEWPFHRSQGIEYKVSLQIINKK